MPADVRAALALGPRERVLAAAREGAPGAAGWVVATNTGLVAQGLRIAWVDVAHVRWSTEESLLAVESVPGVPAPRPLRLAEPGRLPETVHERVMASIVVSRRVSIAGTRGVRVVARRGGGGRGALVWQVVPDAGVDAEHPEVRRAVEETVQRLRAEIGG